MACSSTVTVTDTEIFLQQRLPEGTSSTEVLQVLDSLDVEHSEFEPIRRLITANFGKSGQTGVVRGDVFVIFYFDDNRSLIRSDIREILTGP